MKYFLLIRIGVKDLHEANAKSNQLSFADSLFESACSVYFQLSEVVGYLVIDYLWSYLEKFQLLKYC